MILPVHYLLLLAMMLVSATGEDSPVAKVFLHKYTTSTPVVEEKEFEVIYHLINGGDAAAFNIEVTDRYDPSRYQKNMKPMFIHFLVHKSFIKVINLNYV